MQAWRVREEGLETNRKVNVGEALQLLIGIAVDVKVKI